MTDLLKPEEQRKSDPLIDALCAAAAGVDHDTIRIASAN
jgi:hypothetical protein